MSKKAVLVIQEYLADRYDKPGRDSWRKEYFEQWSYSKWAAKELIRRIQIKKKMPPIVVIGDFINEMNNYSCVNNKSGRMFSIVKDAAEDILDIFLAMQ